MRRHSKAGEPDRRGSRQAVGSWFFLSTWVLFIGAAICLFSDPPARSMPDPFSTSQLFQVSDANPPQESQPADSSLALGVDYFPLTLGNRWIYNKTESRFKKTDTVKVEIIRTPIIKWKTYYVFNQLPFVPGLENANNIPVRYDAPSRSFLKLTPDGEKSLFPVGEQADARFASSVDERSNPVENRLSYMACVRCQNAGMEMVFDRGVGVVAVESTFPWGTETYELKSAEVNRRKFGEPIAEGKGGGKQSKFGTGLVRVDPNLTLDAQKTDNGVKLVFTVKNPTEGYLSFRFNTSQTFDLIVREKDTGFEIWRWSKGNFFSRVLRNVALLPQDEWKFEENWDYKDNERNEIRRGTYEVVALLTTVEPRESAPVDIMVP
ncbi:MAG TPA: BsuPI-related putative proteinase inhibitor [Terriglobia bacterium]|nr:BsuPI-related putative proteinase inhibitor [Terriglobia bacterium]